MKRGRRYAVFAARVAILGAVGLGALLAALWIERRFEITPPAPTGPFAVTRAIYDWTGDSTSAPLAAFLGWPREFLVWIWYPSAAGKSGVADDNVPAQMRAAAAPASLQ